MFYWIDIKFLKKSSKSTYVYDADSADPCEIFIAIFPRNYIIILCVELSAFPHSKIPKTETKKKQMIIQRANTRRNFGIFFVGLK